MTETGKTTISQPATENDLVEADVNFIRDPALIETRREQLLDAALALFLEKGFAATTIRDICARSGVNQASIYDYVANKQDILRRLLNRHWFRSNTRTLPERLADPSNLPLEEILRSFFDEGWNARREGALLAYRTVPHLDEQDRRALREREQDLLGSLSTYLRARTGASVDDKRVEVVANFIIYTNAFSPLRGWLNREVDQGVMMQTVIDGIMAMVEQLRQPER